MSVLRSTFGLLASLTSLASLTACTSSAPTLLDATTVVADAGTPTEARVGPDLRPTPPSLTCAELRKRYPKPTRITTARMLQALIPDDLSEVLLVKDKTWTLNAFALASGKLWRLPPPVRSWGYAWCWEDRRSCT